MSIFRLIDLFCPGAESALGFVAEELDEGDAVGPGGDDLSILHDDGPERTAPACDTFYGQQDRLAQERFVRRGDGFGSLIRFAGGNGQYAEKNDEESVQIKEYQSVVFSKVAPFFQITSKDSGSFLFPFTIFAKIGIENHG